MDYDKFSRRVLELLDIDGLSSVGPDESLYSEIGLDSLQAFQLIVIIEALADATPIDDVPELYTMKDAFDYYELLCDHQT